MYLSGFALIILAIAIIWWIGNAKRNAATEAIQVSTAHHANHLERLHDELARALEPYEELFGLLWVESARWRQQLEAIGEKPFLDPTLTATAVSWAEKAATESNRSFDRDGQSVADVVPGIMSDRFARLSDLGDSVKFSRKPIEATDAPPWRFLEDEKDASIVLLLWIEAARWRRQLEELEREPYHDAKLISRAQECLAGTPYESVASRGQESTHTILDLLPMMVERRIAVEAEAIANDADVKEPTPPIEEALENLRSMSTQDRVKGIEQLHWRPDGLDVVLEALEDIDFTECCVEEGACRFVSDAISYNYNTFIAHQATGATAARARALYVRALGDLLPTQRWSLFREFVER
ncbi:MAG: hypothetical protein H0U13_10890, partial [Gemmatimonadaceae bacterium]|nr:hypothetical protein [Gemmatimonadaceae bacterium]